MRMISNRRGAVAALSAVVMIAVLGFAGLAVDLTRIWMVNARLKTAIDAASLVAARQISLPQVQRDAQVQALYWANFSQNGRTYTYLGATVTDAVITQVDANRIQVTGTAVVPTTLFSIISRQNVSITDSAIAERQGTGLELSIVLDQTSSMRASAPGFASKLAAAQSATNTLLGILYGSNDVQRNLWVSVVPFARTINVGPSNTALLNTTNMPAPWNVANWSGCVEARRNGNDDISDLGPSDPGGTLRPYFDNSTYRRVGYNLFQGSTRITNTTTLNAITSQARNVSLWNTATQVPATGPGNIYPGYTVPIDVGANACATSEDYNALTVNLFATSASTTTTTYTVAFCRGDNDFTNPNGLSGSTGAGASYNPEYAALVGYGFSGVGNTPTHAAGPNRLCAQTPILPLTASRTTVQARVDAITAPVRSGGTTIVAGMQGAWYTLSPRWQTHWPGIGTSADLGTLPLAYNTRNMIKAVILLTDGDNNWQGTYASGVRGSPTATELLYNAYGRVADWNANFPADQISPVSQTNADPRLDGRFAALCTAMKAQGIRVYIVGFEIANNTQREMLRTCATTRDSPYFLEAPTAADLTNAFTIIANQLASLRLVQ